MITAETVRRGAARGFAPALFVQFGSLVGDTTWAIIALTGLAFIVQNNIARIILSLIGILLMLKLAWDAITGFSFWPLQVAIYASLVFGVLAVFSGGIIPCSQSESPH